MESLVNNAKLMGIEVDRPQAQQLIEYLQLIIKWNKTYNLSAIRSVEDGIHKHLLDSLSILPHIKESSLLDVGAGAGLPGIVIAIMRPNLSVTLLDSVGKKCRFMQFVKSDLKLENLTVINARVEDYQPKSCFGQITSRAFSSVDKMLKFTQHLLCDNGSYLLMKGVNFQREHIPETTKAHQLFVPNVSDKRYLLEIRSTK